MLQIVLEKPGKFLATDGPEPTLAPGQALVRVHRIGICGTDLHAFAGKQPFFSYPRILGHELGVEVIDPGSEPHGLSGGDGGRWGFRDIHGEWRTAGRSAQPECRQRIRWADRSDRCESR